MRYLYLMLFIFPVACSSPNSETVSSEDVTTIEVNIDEAEPVYMSEYFSGIDYIYLESPEDRPIGRIRK